MFTGQMNRSSAVRRLAIVLWATALLFVMSGCGGDDKQEAAAVPAQTPQAMVPAGTDTALADSLMQEHPTGTSTATGVHSGAGSAGSPDGTLEATESPAEKSAAAEVKSPFNRSEVTTGGGAYSLQLGSFSSSENARNQAARIRDLGHNPVVEVASLGGQTYHRVVLRGLADRNEAERLGEKIRSQLGITYLIRQK